MADGKKTKKAKTAEQKAADFIKLATKHTNTALAALSRLGKMGNTNKYASTKQQREKIREALESGARSALAALESGGVTGGVDLS